MASILSVQPDVPDETFGGRKRVYHLTRALLQHGHCVHMLAATMSASDEARLRPLQEMGIETTAARHPQAQPPVLAAGGSAGVPIPGRIRDALLYRRGVLASVLGSQPQALRAESASPLKSELERLLERHRFDLVIIENEENVLLAQSLPLDLPLVLDAQNVLSRMAQRDLAQGDKRARFSLERVRDGLQPARLRRLERWMMSRCDAVVAMSEDEAASLREVAVPEHTARARVVGNGVDTARYSCSIPTPARDRVLFTGLMSWYPNADAAAWFVREIWPLVLRRKPLATLQIVGAAPYDELRAMASDSALRVEVTGEVLDVLPFFEGADVVVVPMRRGGGTRLKVLEAASTRRPLVCTTMGAEGIGEMRDGEHLLLRDEPHLFAQAVADLLDDPAQGQRLAYAARAVVEEHYDWEILGRQFCALIDEILAASSTSTSAKRAST